MQNTIPGAALAILFLYQGPLQAGDAAAGEGAFNARGCIACHGVAGKAPIAPNYPVIGGRDAAFISGELGRFRSGERQEPTMNALAAMLNDADIANIATYLATR